jgi:hypothetical protein
MSGRRSHVRFAVLQSPEGMLRVLQDVVIQNTRADQTIALSREPGVLGELVSVQCPHRDDTSVWARVLESQPVVVDGTVRHRLRLRHLGEASVEGQDDDDEAAGMVSQ